MPEEEGTGGRGLSFQDRKYLVLEVCALNASHLVSIAGQYLGFVGRTRTIFQASYAAYSLLGDLGRMALYLFVMYASGDSLSCFGLRKLNWKRDLLALICAMVGVCVIHLVISRAMLFRLPFDPRVNLDLFPNSIPSKDVTPYWLAALVCTAIGVAEEMMFRGYLITRLEQLSGKTWIAVIGQAAFFGLGHIYEGIHGMLFAAANGLLFGAIYAKSRSIWPIALAHGLLDFFIYFETMRQLTNG